ncbi:MAG: hypothetical protein WC222_01245 [Parachlamydiales bacterium]|jgi:uncharacterized membrane protein YeaQ/YmgE (transglycosylase-associated protein family)
MDIINLIISLISGVAGGNLAGAGLKEKNLGAIGNTITGLLGGAGGNYLLQILDIFNKVGATGAVGAAPATGTEFDIGHLLANIATSGVGGAALSAIVAYVKSALNKA